ncbi:MAG: CotH kinase family protein [Saprospiraceae bacterium]
MHKYQLLFLILFLVNETVTAQVRINEICSDNKTTITDDFGEASDWIELYNTGTESVDLTGYFLSDNSDQPNKWTFPNLVISPNQHLILFASGRDLSNSYVHTNFKLSKDGEVLLLSDNDGNLLDQIGFPSLDEDVSYGRSELNSQEWLYFGSPTPEFENNDSSSFQFNETPIFENTESFHESSVIIVLSCSDENCEIRFTTDGSVPTESDQLYLSPIVSDTTICVRAVSFSSDKLPSAPATETYFVDTNHELPIFTLSTDPFLLFDDMEGIFTLGPDGDSIYPFWGANFWKDITIPLHVEYFVDHELAVEFDVGTKVHGGKSSRTRKMKSFQLIADKKYGEDKMNYQFFDYKENDSYTRLVLRNASGDFNFTHFRDAYIHRYLATKETHLDIIAHQPVVVYINSQYWGIMNLREKINEHYVGDNHSVDINNVDMLEEDSLVIEGNMDIFNEMLDSVLNSNILLEESLEMAERNFDLDNLIDYVVTEMALCNSDWPGNNVKYWRERKQGAKWRYILLDLDAIMGRAPYTEADADYFHNLMTLERFDNIKLVRLIRTLLLNQTFRNRFLNRYADLLNTLFRSENLIAETARTEAELDAEMFRHFQKWTWPGYEVWQSDRLPTLYNFARDRPPYARQHLMEEFELSNEVEIELNVYPPEAGRIQINTIQPEDLPWTGHYFNGVPVTLTVVPNPGFTFSHWGSSKTILNPENATQIKLNFEVDDEVTAFFETEAISFKTTLYPNPSKDAVNISFPLTEIVPVSIYLYDVTGKEIQQFDFGRIGGGLRNLSIDISTLPNGVYMIETVAGEKRSIEKLFKINAE